ncbi:MAG: hypothetical protein J6N95_07120 [Bacilli bacterium]|nr:hypothetical protein [Bacilli bacterium]
MYYVPYFKSKKHIISFVSFIVGHSLNVVLFVAGIIVTLLSKEPDIQKDPVVTGFVVALIISVFLSIFLTIYFIIDLVSFNITKRKAKTLKKNNVEVVLNKAPISINKDETLRTAIGDAIADVKSKEEEITPEYQKTEEYKPSYKKSLMIFIYANWLSLVIFVPICLAAFTGLVFLLNLNDTNKALIQTAIVCGTFILGIITAILLFPAVMVRNQKKLHPDETGIRIYQDTIEYYMHINQDVKGQNIDAKLKTTIEISKMKYFETKKRFFAKQRIFKQYSVLIITKDEQSNELLDIIHNKIKDNRK